MHKRPAEQSLDPSPPPPPLSLYSYSLPVHTHYLQSRPLLAHLAMPHNDLRFIDEIRATRTTHKYKDLCSKIYSRGWIIVQAERYVSNTDVARVTFNHASGIEIMDFELDADGQVYGLIKSMLNRKSMGLSGPVGSGR